MKRLRDWWFLIALLVAAVVYIGLFAEQSEVPDELQGEWKLATLNLDGDRWEFDDDSALAITISADRLSGTTGCNDIDATASYNAMTERPLVFTDIEITERACEDPDLATVESTFIDALNDFEVFQSIGTDLVLQTNDKSLFLRFEQTT